MKVRVTQDYLYEYLTAHSINIKTLAELAGVSSATMSMCFHHQLNNRGKQCSFTSTALVKLNDALPVLASFIRDSVIMFGTGEVFTNSCGRTYDPGIVQSFKALSRYFNIKGLCEKVLGWKMHKTSNILSSPSGNTYGFIKFEDVTNVNMELLSVAGVLSCIEVTKDGDLETAEEQKAEGAKPPKEKKGKKKKLRKGDGLYWNWMGELPNQE